MADIGRSIELRAGMALDGLVGRRFTTAGGLTVTVEQARHATGFQGVALLVTVHQPPPRPTNSSALGLLYGEHLTPTDSGPR